MYDVGESRTNAKIGKEPTYHNEKNAQLTVREILRKSGSEPRVHKNNYVLFPATKIQTNLFSS